VGKLTLILFLFVIAKQQSFQSIILQFRNKSFGLDYLFCWTEINFYYFTPTWKLFEIVKSTWKLFLNRNVFETFFFLFWKIKFYCDVTFDKNLSNFMSNFIDSLKGIFLHHLPIVRSKMFSDDYGFQVHLFGKYSWMYIWFINCWFNYSWIRIL
jgi:hypothetical protein